MEQQDYFEYLIDHYQNLIYSVCYKSIGNTFDAQDLTQDVFLSAYKKLPDFDRKFERAWLCKIAANKCLDFLKSAGRRSIPTEDDYFLELSGKSCSPEETYLEDESKQQVHILCERLKSPYKEIALQHFCQELSIQEIAQRSGKNLKTLQTQLYRAKGMLKTMLERSG